jgi:predicted DNA-binding transcriptional regulator AlpA
MAKKPRTHTDLPARPPVDNDLVLTSKSEVLLRVSISFVQIWRLMQQDPPGFPRARTVGNRLVWYKHEIDQWLANVPLKKYPGNSDGVVVPDHFQHERRRAEQKAAKARSKKAGA